MTSGKPSCTTFNSVPHETAVSVTVVRISPARFGSSNRSVYTMRWFGTTEAQVPEYVAAMRAKHGEAAEQILIEGSPHVMVFPNLFIAEIQVFNIQPVSVNECVQYATAVQFAGAPELNRRMVSQCIGSVGPAGMLLADDTEMYERNQVGLEARDPEWVDIRRGLNREYVDERGHPVGGPTDETGMRAFWAQYKKQMEES